MPTTHALLSPSASKRWMSCTPPARLEVEVPRRETSYSREGTIAHSVAEILLREALKADNELFKGHTTLVEESDPRPAMNSTQTAINDFQNVLQ